MTARVVCPASWLSFGTAAGTAAGAVVRRGGGRVQPRLGVDQKRARRGHPIAGLQSFDDRIHFTGPRAKLDFHPFKQPRLAFHVHDLLHAGVDHGPFGNRQNSAGTTGPCRLLKRLDLGHRAC